MIIVILTTETPHHIAFVRAIARAFPDCHVLDEQRRVAPRFAVHHPFEDARDAFERVRWFDGVPIGFSTFARTTVVGSVNDADARAVLDEVRPDVILSFGVGKIGTEVIARCPERIVNLHGGDPEEYRGLDSHLWAIYHRDWSALTTTLHFVNEHFDDGGIIQQATVPLRRGMELHELRAANTETCAAITLAALRMYERSGRFSSRPQQRSGRYYSFMPTPLKAMCVEHFARYAATLEERVSLHETLREIV